MLGLRQVRPLFKQLTSQILGCAVLIPQPYLSMDTMHMVCAKSYGKCLYWLEKFNAGLLKLQKNGRLNEILDEALKLSTHPALPQKQLFKP